MGLRKGLTGVLAAIIATAASTAAIALPAERPVAGKQVHFPNGVWSGLPQVGPNGKVRQCVMVAMRQRAGKDGPIETRLAVDISAGAGLVVTIQDDGLPAPTGYQFEFPLRASVVPWLRACARRNGFAIEPATQ
jgi:hypothetical protein